MCRVLARCVPALALAWGASSCGHARHARHGAPMPLFDSRVALAPLADRLKASGGDESRVLRPAKLADLDALEGGRRYKFVVLAGGGLAVAPLPADQPGNEYTHPVLAGGQAVMTAGGLRVDRVAGGALARVAVDQDSKAYCPTAGSLDAALGALAGLGVPAALLRVENRPPQCIDTLAPAPGVMSGAAGATPMSMSSPAAQGPPAAAGAASAPGGSGTAAPGASTSAAAASSPSVRETGPRYGALMAEVGHRFETMGRAAKAGRFDLAAFELGELGEIFHDDLPHAALPRESQGVNLTGVADAFMMTNLPELDAALRARDHKQLAQAVARAAATCNGCHQASGHRFVEVPSEVGASVPVIDARPSHPASTGR